jgi:hypothetical protein
MRKLSKFVFASKRKKAVFSLVSLRSETLEITSETKASEAKKKNQEKRNGTEKLPKSII